LKKYDLKYVATLEGHDDKVLCILVSSEFSIIISGSLDGTAIIWDANRLRFITSLNHDGPVTSLTIHRYYGYIYTVSNSNQDSIITLWSINGKKIKTQSSKDKINTIEVSSIKPGMGQNIIITGHESGMINIWDALSLQHMASISVHITAVTSITINNQNTYFVSGDRDGLCIIHEDKNLDEFYLINVM